MMQTRFPRAGFLGAAALALVLGACRSVSPPTPLVTRELKEEEKAALGARWSVPIPAIVMVEQEERREKVIEHLSNHLFDKAWPRREVDWSPQEPWQQVLVIRARITPRADDVIEASLELSVLEMLEGAPRLRMRDTCTGECPIDPKDEDKGHAEALAVEFAIRNAIEGGCILESLVRHATYEPPPPSPARPLLFLTFQEQGLGESEVLSSKAVLQRSLEPRLRAILDEEHISDSEVTRTTLTELRRRLSSDADGARVAAMSQWLPFMVPIACCRLSVHKVRARTRVAYVVQLSMEDLTLFDSPWRPLVYQETTVDVDLESAVRTAAAQMLEDARFKEYLQRAAAAVGVLGPDIRGKQELDALFVEPKG